MFRSVKTNTCVVILWWQLPGDTQRLKKYTTSPECMQPIPRAPTCSAANVHARAVTAGLPANRPYAIRYVNAGDGVAWYVNETDGDWIGKISDDC